MIDRRRVAALIRKDWRELSRNKQALAPLVIVPLLFVVVIPVAVILLGANTALTSTVGGLQSFLDHLPTDLLPADLTSQQAVVYAVRVYFMAPFFLIIPVMVASITAASSFVGEKERRTIEGLLYTPLTDRELVLGKVLVCVVPSVVLAWTSFAVYTVIVDVLAAPRLGEFVFPTVTWAVLVVVLVPLIAFLATCLVVAVSGRSSTMQEAQGVAALVILPVVGLVVGQASGLMLFDVGVALAVSAVVLVADAAVYLAVVARFRRERIVARL
ncbi:MAG TPA: ABC transporter permease subunit [Actinotalea sp.]|nr:ABC transporter permease subunit [Actinotalea sp.]